MKSAFAVDVDDELVLRAQAGEREALFEIYNRFERPVYSLAYRFTQCPQQSQDILQDTMLCLVEKIGQYRFQGPFWGWARRVSINSALMHLRSHNSHRRHVEILVDSQVVSDAGNLDMARDIATAFARLAPERRVVLWLYAVEGYTHREIAALMGYTESYSKTQLMRARRQVRQWWRQHAREEDMQGEVFDEQQ